MTPVRGGKEEPSQVSLRGRPSRLSGELRLSKPAAAAEGVELELEGAEGARASLRRRGAEGPGSARLKLRLPRATPPGTYRGEARVGEERFSVLAEVEARARLRLAPKSLSLTAAPGSEVVAEIALTNAGNVPVDIPARSSFCLFDWSGINPAFGVALGKQPPEGKRRIDVLMDELAGYHGGFVKAVLKKGSGKIPPGETRTLQVILSIPEGLVPGHAYTGTWLLHNRNYRVAVAAVAGQNVSKGPTKKRSRQ